MQITDVGTFLVQDRERPERNYAFLKVSTDEGLTGLGEAGITGKELALAGLIDTYAPISRGDGPVPHRAHLADAVAEPVLPRRARARGCGGRDRHRAVGPARQGARRPVYNLLGGRTRDYARVLLARGPARRSRRRAGIDAMVSDAREQVAPGRQIRRGRGQTRGPRWGV
jgi:galactonate dehydratase